MIDARHRLDHPDRLPSPCLLVFEEVVRDNLAAMIRIGGSTDRLRLHAKTHKMAAIIRLEESLGFHKHKCATIAEAEMIAEAGGRDILIAYPLVGPNIVRLIALIRGYPGATFRAIVDHPGPAAELGAAARSLERPISTLVDLEIGMGRTGIVPGEEAIALYRQVANDPGLQPDGLHAYDGHIRDPDPVAREEAAIQGLRPVLELRDHLIGLGHPVPKLVVGGTPTFPIHARSPQQGLECSPGTTTLHDAGYATRFPDLPFTPAALLLTRVVSHPRPGRITLDLGHKAVAADPDGDRLMLPGLPGARFIGQSEEHLVVEGHNMGSIPQGTALLAIPMHICPTVALHSKAYVVREGRVIDEWEVTARDRILTY